MYLAMQLIKTLKGSTLGIEQGAELSFSNGMVEAIPVFKTKKAAKKFAGAKYDIVKIEVSTPG